MFSLEGGIEDILMVPLHPHSALLIIGPVPDLAFLKIHITGIQHELMTLGKAVIQLHMRPQTVLFIGISPVLCAFAG